MANTSLNNKAILAIFGFLVLTIFYTSAHAGNPDFLWEVVSMDCVPNQKDNKNPDPCVEVNLEKDGDRGYAVFKDYNGPLQYLLLPTIKVTGIESAEVLTAESPNYFYQAWEARSHMEKLYGSAIAPEEISLTVNSQLGRSQNQLHIHISCTRLDVKNLIQQNLDKIGNIWSEFPGGILGHNYFSRRITFQQLKEQNVFQLLANDLTDAKLNMQEYGLAVVAVKNVIGEVDFVMLADRADAAKMDKGHVEEIQDHQCPQLYGN